MLESSSEYKTSMRQVVRNRGYIEVVINAVNLNAQESQVVTNTDTVYFSQSSVADSRTGEYKIYATAEKDFSKVDDSMYFLPRENTESYIDCGLIPEDLGNKPIQIKFSDGQHSLYGLTIDFGEFYPTEFNLVTNLGSTTYTNDDAIWVLNKRLIDVTYIKIVPTKMSADNVRFRIYALLCGVEISLDNTDVQDYTWKSYMSQISESIPSIDETITIDNSDSEYNLDNEKSLINFLQPKQEVKTRFGYDVAGDDNIEWLDWRTNYLSSWAADETSMTFNTKDM